MSDEYEKFQKFIREDMIKEWRNVKLSYVVSKHNIDLVLSRDSSLTIQKIIEDFQKSPLVKEVIMDRDHIVIFPK